VRTGTGPGIIFTLFRPIEWLGVVRSNLACHTSRGPLRCGNNSQQGRPAREAPTMCRIKASIRLSALLVILFAATPASATDFCVVQKSADGFVALRSKPSADGALLRRAQAGHTVIIQKSKSGDQIAHGSWLRVMHFAEPAPPLISDPAYKTGMVGWIHSRYVDECG